MAKVGAHGPEGPREEAFDSRIPIGSYPITRGTLYLVSTPIGNLGDISLRALETLRQVDLIASEDTRKTGHLLRHFGLGKAQVAFHAHNEHSLGPRLIERLSAGQALALVTNAGTPGIADPGYSLVRLAHEAGIPVTMIPGPSALVMALVLSGLPTHSFTFRGFTPHRRSARRRYLSDDCGSPHTLIYYESPYRLRESLEDAISVLGDRPAALANDLTKMFEKVSRGRLSELLAGLGEGDLLGEFVLVIGGAEQEKREAGARLST